MSGWKPIETVPKKKVVLMWGMTDILSNGIQNWKMETGCVYSYAGKDAEVTEWGGSELKEWDHKPTHWMSLPEPPEV